MTSTLSPNLTPDRTGGLISPVIGGRLAIVYGVGTMIMGAAQAIRPPEDSIAAIDTPMRWLLAMFAVILVAVAPAHLSLAKYAGGPWGGRLVAIGTPLLAVGAMSSAINGEDMAWFPPLAALANLLWLVGSLMLGVSLWKAGRVSRWIAVLLPVSMPFTLVLSQQGSGLPIGAFWITVGALMATGHLARR